MAVVGSFAYEDDFLAAARSLKSSGFENISLLSPLPLEEAQEILELGKSPVRRFSLAGALIGAASGFAMAVATAREPASHKLAWNNLKQATPIIAERTCPPIKFRG